MTLAATAIVYAFFPILISLASPAQTQNPWKPDSTLLRQLTQPVMVDSYRITIPADYTGGASQGTPAYIRTFGWVGKSKAGEAAGVFYMTVISKDTIVNEVRNNTRPALETYGNGVIGKMGIEIATRHESEKGEIAGIKFTRFAWAGKNRMQDETKGYVYGAVDKDKAILFVSIGNSPNAESQNKLNEAIISTLKKK